ncbi:hypothetical protein Tco_0208338, partial [Tanacetum coccineum]
MGDKNSICTLGDYSRSSHEGYQNTIELPDRNNVDPSLPGRAGYHETKDLLSKEIRFGTIICPRFNIEKFSDTK